MRKFIGGTLYTNNLVFKKLSPCSNETSAETGHTVRGFIELFGLPLTLHSDNNKKRKKGIFKQLLQWFGIIPAHTEPHLNWQNRAEPVIGEVNINARKLMIDSNNPILLWCFCYEYTADIIYLCATGCFESQGRTLHETVMNYTPAISEYASFSWFYWSWFYDDILKRNQLCRWLRPAHGFGKAF